MSKPTRLWGRSQLTFWRELGQHVYLVVMKMIGPKLMSLKLMSIMFICSLMVGFGLMSPLKLKAQEHETPLGSDPRLIELEFDPQQSYLILTRPKSVTLIQMSPEESVVTAVAGDTVNFSVVVSQSRNYVMVRPKYEALTTSLTLITNKRDYPLTLRSTKEAVGKWYQRVQWRYPNALKEEEVDLLQLSAGETPLKSSLNSMGSNNSMGTEEAKVRHRMRQRRWPNIRSQDHTALPHGQEGEVVSKFESEYGIEMESNLDSDSDSGSKTTPFKQYSPRSQTLSVDVSHLNTRYTIQGATPFRPVLVFDDGIRTYFKMPRTMQSMPALFALEDGATQLVNYTVHQEHMVAQGLHSGYVLKLADKEVRITMSPEEAQGFWGRFLP